MSKRIYALKNTAILNRSAKTKDILADLGKRLNSPRTFFFEFQVKFTNPNEVFEKIFYEGLSTQKIAKIDFPAIFVHIFYCKFSKILK